MSDTWFRIYNDFYKNPTLQSLAFEDQRHYVVIMCLKGDGVLDRPITENNRNRIICKGLGLSAVVGEEVKRRLMEVDLIDGNWHPKDWEKHSYKSDGSTERTRKYRKNKEKGNVTGTSQERFTPIPYPEIMAEYHRLLPMLPKVIKLTEKRRRQIRKLWSDEKHGLPTLASWQNFFGYVAKSRFLTGRVLHPNKNSFRADLEWLTNYTNFIKISEDKYHGKI